MHLMFYLYLTYCLITVAVAPSIISGTRAGKPNRGLEFFTRSLPCLTELHSLFYPSGVKIIPDNIYELLTPVALARGGAAPHVFYV